MSLVLKISLASLVLSSLVFFVFPLLTGEAQGQGTRLDFEAGAPFPNLVLPDLEGRPLSVEAFRGQKVILHLFASW